MNFGGILELTYVPLKEEHLDRVLEIELVSFPSPWTRAMFKREIGLNVSSFFAVFVGEELAGYGGFWSVEDEGSVVSIAVAPARRSSGIGRSILEHFLSLMRLSGLKKAFLEVRIDNVPAIRLYEKAGFARTGIRKGYYNGIDAVVMERPL